MISDKSGHAEEIERILRDWLATVEVIPGLCIGTDPLRSWPRDKLDAGGPPAVITDRNANDLTVLLE
jgi:hypothetical protein